MFRPFVRSIIVLAILAWFFPTISFSNWIALVIASIVLTITFGLIRPVLSIVLLPISVVTIGLFSIVLNVLLLWMVTYIVPGFTIEPTIILGVAMNQFFTLLTISSLITLMQSLIKMVF
jgi:putative membrane protein